MIGIKNMKMPCDCWNCELTYENFSGLTICPLSRMPLYPMGSKDKREDDCLLVEIKENEGKDNDC